MRKLLAFFQRLFATVIAVISRIAEALLSNRGLTVVALLGCALLAVSTWLRPAISRDFRAIHIPWVGSPAAQFSPDRVVEVPRPWRWDSVGAPIFALSVIGIPLVLLRPKWTRFVFGAVLAVAIPAVAAAFWNHPALVEFLEGEVRQRAMVRAVIRQHADDMLSGGAPDRLSVLGAHTSSIAELETVHPIWYPIRYSVYGHWLIELALAGVLIAQAGRWHDRLRYAAVPLLVGLAFAVAITWPRIVAEYRWAQCDAQE